ncbi:MAG: DUF3098 domain-containing protein [Bacteroidota bacterium]|nr:DUF3098 domain-containing protein [Bacteroidota bacterium]
MQKTTHKTAPKHPDYPNSFAFGKANYRWMFIGLAVIVLGFILMYGKEDIYDTRKIIVAPVVVLIGFAIQAYAIMKKSAE